MRLFLKSNFRTSKISGSSGAANTPGVAIEQAHIAPFLFTVSVPESGIYWRKRSTPHRTRFRTQRLATGHFTAFP